MPIQYRTRSVPPGTKTLTYTPKVNEVVLQYSTIFWESPSFAKWLKYPDIGSALIRYRGHKWSHLDIVNPDGWLTGARDDVWRVPNPKTRKIETYQSGVQKRPPQYCQFAHALRVSIQTPRASEYYAWIERQIGKPYDQTAILGFILGRNLDRNWRAEDSWFCDELGLRGFEIINHFGRQLSIPAVQIDPGGSQLALSAGPSYSEIEEF